MYNRSSTEFEDAAARGGTTWPTLLPQLSRTDPIALASCPFGAVTIRPDELAADSESRCSHSSSIAGTREPANLKYTGCVGVIHS